MRLRCATFNALADAYLGYGNYGHAAPALLQPGARLPLVIRCITGLRADVVCLQEADNALAAALKVAGNWQVFWTQKGNGKPDGCLTLVRPGIAVDSFDAYGYDDGTGHIAQCTTIRGASLINTHIKWAEAGDPRHVGVRQAIRLVEWFDGVDRAAIFTDCNDLPGGPVRAVLEAAGFANVLGDVPTALIWPNQAALDIIAVRGMPAEPLPTSIATDGIPTEDCPSDHIPMLASIEV